MVLIHTVSMDRTTVEVIDWFSLLKKDFIRINSDIGYEIKIQSDFFINNVNFNKIKAYWYRKGNLNGIPNHSVGNEKTRIILMENKVKILEYVEFLLCHNKKYLNECFNSNLNKLLILHKAEELKLKIPKFVLTNEFINDSSLEYIYKPINDDSSIAIGKALIGMAYTELYDEEKGQVYGITFFQEMIEKKYELRIFYLDGIFFTMAILSQKDQKTKIDFRHYNEEKPNRNIPFKLPKEIEGKLNLLMKDLNLNSGSIDMIVSKDREYYFLEVNPVGQFGMVSYPCNYYLEKEIAEYLSYD